MSALQLAFECRFIVRSVRSDPDFANVKTLLKQSSKEDLSALCPATNASLLFYAAQRQTDAEAAEICRLLCEEYKACDPAQADRNQQTALFFAARDGNAACVSYLISKGCNPDHRDSASQTAIFYAARDGRTATVEALLDGHADVNAVDHLGQTALFYASRDGRTDTVLLMLGRGASITMKDRQRRTALFYAQKNNHKELAAALKAAGTQSGAGTPARHLSADEASPAVVDADGTRPTKRARVGSPQLSSEASPQVGVLSPPLTSSPAEQVPLPPIRRHCYRLVMKGPSDDPDLEWLSATNDQIGIFESLAPHIAVWPKVNPSPVTDALHDLRPKWQSIATSIMDELSATEGGWIFTKPVDCKAWGCPDYYEVIKSPMDYTTIKKQFKSNSYQKCSEYISDMALIFSNCFRYNKPESPIASIGRNIERMFKELMASRGLDKWVEREEVVERWYREQHGKGNATPEENIQETNGVANGGQ